MILRRRASHDGPDHDGPDRDRLDHDRPDHDRPDHDRPDHDRPDHDRPDHDGPDHDELDRDGPDHDDPLAGEFNDGDLAGEDPDPAPRRWWPAPRREREPARVEVNPDDLELRPVEMRGTESLYGYVVALELIGVSILNLTVTHGKGAPAHPSTSLAVLGLVASIALIAVVRTHHRLVVAFAAIIAAFFATLPKVPNSLSSAHLLALVIPVVYAFLLTQRQRKAASAQARAARSNAGNATGTRGTRATRGTSGPPAQRRPQTVGGRKARRNAALQSGPQPNRRYTPPKAKRPRR